MITGNRWHGTIQRPAVPPSTTRTLIPRSASPASALAAALLVSLPCSLGAQPPERLRIDVTTSFFLAFDQRGLEAGTFGSTFGLEGPTTVAVLWDVSTTIFPVDSLTLSAGLPLGVLLVWKESPQAEESELESGSGGEDKPEPEGAREEVALAIGDVHAEIGYLLIGERAILPALTVQAEGSAPTARFAGMGSGLWRTTGRAVLLKSLGTRVSIFGHGAYSHFVEKKGVGVDPVVSYGGGLNLGIGETVMLSVQTEEQVGGSLRGFLPEEDSPEDPVDPVEEEDGDPARAPTRNLAAGVVITTYSRGRPRMSFGMTAVGLRETPTFLVSVKLAALSF